MIVLVLFGCGGAGEDGKTTLTATQQTLVSQHTFTLTVTTSGMGSGVVTSSPAGITCGVDCAAPYPNDTVVTLTAMAAGGSAFTGWGGDCTGDTLSTTVTMTAAKTCTATFTQTFVLTVSVTGNGTVTRRPSGITCSSGPCTAVQTSGTEVDLTAGPAAGFVFSGWTGACAGSGACRVTMTVDRSVSATFVLGRPSAPTGLTATPGNGLVSLAWNPNLASEQVTTYTLYMALTSWTTWSLGLSGAVVRAALTSTTFTQTGLTNGTTYRFAVSATNSAGEGAQSALVSVAPTAATVPVFLLSVAVVGNGAVTWPGNTCPSGTCTASYPKGTVVTLTATPAAGSVFANFGGGCVSATTSCALTLAASTSVTVTFNSTISGTARFEKKVVNQTGLTNTIVLTSIRSANVEVFRDADGTVVATGDTDSSGNFSLVVPAAESLASLRARVVARQVNSTLNVRVVDALNEAGLPYLITGTLYAVTSGSFAGSQTGVVMTATADDQTGRRAGAFNIFDAFIKATDFIKAAAPQTIFPPVVFRFNIGVGGTTGFTGGTTQVFADRLADRISISDSPSNTDDFDDSVILHEVGHYLAKNFSKDGTPGGPHTQGQRLDPRLAWSEGWATFFAQAVLGSPRFIDSASPVSGSFSVETFKPAVMATTYESEDASSQVLWDLFDSGTLSTDGDTMALGFVSLWNQGLVSLRSPGVRFTYLHSLLDTLKAAGTITATDITNNFCTILKVCDPPFNERFTPSSPSPFPQLEIGPTASFTAGVNCFCKVNAGLGQATLASANDFYLLRLSSPGTLTITLTTASPNLDNLDLYLHEDEQGQSLVGRTGPTGNEDTARSLQSGPYMIQVNGVSTSSGAGPLISYGLTTAFTP